MTRKLISAFAIESDKRIEIPRDSNTYKIDRGNHKIEFYQDNPGFRGAELSTWKTDENAREIEFELRDDRIGGNIFIPKFYDDKGNLLKIGNR